MLTGMINFAASTSSMYYEISFPPFNILMSLSTVIPDKRLTDITWLRIYNFHDKAEINIPLFKLAVHTYFPADYRTFDEIADLERQS